MAKVKVDMTGVESFTLCEEGKHPAIIKGLELKKNGNDDDMLTASLEITAGESKGARVMDNYTLTPKALWKLKQVLEALGGFKAEGKLVLDTDKMLSKPFILEVAHEEYNGQMRARAVGYFKVGTAAKPAAEKAPAIGTQMKMVAPVEDEDWDEA